LKLPLALPEPAAIVKVAPQSVLTCTPPSLTRNLAQLLPSGLKVTCWWSAWEVVTFGDPITGRPVQRRPGPPLVHVPR
jgi:hypothetical protein